MRKKYFLVYDGKETEEIYFEGVNQNRSMIGINPLIELVPVVRSYSEEGWSKPKKIVDRMLLNLKESRLGTVSYETLLNWFMDYLYEETRKQQSKSQKSLADVGMDMQRKTADHSYRACYRSGRNMQDAG